MSRYHLLRPLDFWFYVTNKCVTHYVPEDDCHDCNPDDADATSDSNQSPAADAAADTDTSSDSDDSTRHSR